MEEKKEKKQISIFIKLLAMVVLPCVVMGLSLNIMAGKSMEDGLCEEAIQGLKASAYTVREIYDNMDEGDFRMDEKGEVYKGSHKISGNYEIADNVKSNTGVDITLFYGDTRVATSLKDKSTGERLVGTKASDQVIETVLKKGKDYYDLNIEINGEPYYGYYVPMKNTDGEIVGMAFAGDVSSQQQEYIRERIIRVTILAVAIGVLGILYAVFTSVPLARSIRKTEDVILELENGNLTVQVDEKVMRRNDELGAMARSVNHLKNRLFEIIGGIKKSSEVLYNSGESLSEMALHSSSTTSEMNKVIEDISQGAVSQAEEIETASQNIGTMGEVIEEIVTSADTLGTASAKMKSASDESNVIIRQLSESNDKTTAAFGRISRQIYETNDSMQLIDEAIELITSIAGQTNLLALNASIEAARAGEHGKGFAVVATEIQKLADQSNSSAEKIKEIIRDVMSESNATVQVMKEVEKIISEQQEKLNETRTKFAAVTQGVDASREEAEIIQGHTEVCDASREKVIDVIQNLSAISQENAASTQESTASMNELNETIRFLADAASNLQQLSRNLEREMEFFKI